MCIPLAGQGARFCMSGFKKKGGGCGGGGGEEEASSSSHGQGNPKIIQP